MLLFKDISCTVLSAISLKNSVLKGFIFYKQYPKIPSISLFVKMHYYLNFTEAQNSIIYL